MAGLISLCPYLCLIAAGLFAHLSLQQQQNSQQQCSQEGAMVERVNVYYTCRGQSLTLTGCLGYNGTRVPLGSTYKIFGYEMLCQRANQDWASLVPLGCVVNGKQLKVGQTVIQGAFWYTCVKVDNTVRTVWSGCVGPNDKLYTPGQLFVKTGFVMMCNQGENRFSVDITGCVNDKQNTVYGLGKRWIEGSGSMKFVIQCVGLPGNRVEKRVVQCAYDAGQPGVDPQILDPGCSRKIGDITVVCQSRGHNNIGFETFSRIDKSAQDLILAKGKTLEGVPEFDFSLKHSIIVSCIACFDLSSIVLYSLFQKTFDLSSKNDTNTESESD